MLIVAPGLYPAADADWKVSSQSRLQAAPKVTMFSSTARLSSATMLEVTRVFAIVLFQSDYRLRAHQAPCFARAARYASVLMSSDIPMGADDDALTGLIGAGALLIFAAATGSSGSDASILPIAQ